MKTLSALLTGALLVCGASSIRVLAALGPPDEAFIKVAAQHSMAEIRLGEIAKAKATQPGVKEFGETMATDFSKAKEELRKLAAANDITISDNLEEQYQATVDRFEELYETEFDKSFIDQMVGDHEKNVAAFEAASRTAENPALKAFMEKTLPTLREHLKRGQALQKGIPK